MGPEEFEGELAPADVRLVVLLPELPRRLDVLLVAGELRQFHGAIVRQDLRGRSVAGIQFQTLYGAVAERYGQAALEPGGLVASPLEAVSLGVALMFGVLGLPHILMRFYTVSDSRTARGSVDLATAF